MFEGSIPAQEEKDDESVSGKSMRSLFEMEHNDGITESEVNEIRAIFENKNSRSTKVKRFKGNTVLKDTWSKV